MPTSNAPDPTLGLRLALRANALFSGTCAAIFVLDAGALAGAIGVPAPLLVTLGAGLLAFAGALVWTSLRSDVGRLIQEARLHCAADLAWVVGSVPVVVMGWLEPVGSAGLMAVSTVVLSLAVAQWRGLGRASAPDLRTAS